MLPKPAASPGSATLTRTVKGEQESFSTAPDLQEPAGPPGLSPTATPDFLPPALPLPAPDSPPVPLGASQLSQCPRPLETDTRERRMPGTATPRPTTTGVAGDRSSYRSTPKP